MNVASATSITVKSPPGGSGTVDVTVTTPGGTSATTSADQFTYDAAPTVTLLVPTAGPTAGGTSVIITGTSFTAGSIVKFGTNAATVTSVSPTSITATSPSGAAGAVDVTVTTPGGTSATSGSDKFTYEAAPTVTSVAPNTGSTAGGGSVTIKGANYMNGFTTVSFGGAAATITSFSNNQLVVTLPAHAAGTVDVIVTTLGGPSAVSSLDHFTYS